MNRGNKAIISLFLALALIFSLSACAKSTAENAAAEQEKVTSGEQTPQPEGETGRVIENGGFKLLIPSEYDALLLTEAPQDDPDGFLFNVSEKASVEAAKAMGVEDFGPGWLFSIGRVDDARQKMMRCFDMSGAEIFARDAGGNHYVFYHPTDVRYTREDNEAMIRDQEQWSKLNDWAWNTVRLSFLRENPGLSEKSCTNTLVDMFLARLAYLPGTEYTLSATEQGAFAPGPEGFDAKPWLDALTDGAAFTWADESETPDGEYLVLSFPKDDIRFDFFRMEGKENYVRAVWNGGETGELYLAHFADDTIKASKLVQAWYDALAAQQDTSEAS